MTGTVKWFNAEKGYGFIVTEDEQEIFAHFSNIKVDGYKTLEADSNVTFDIEECEKGLQAVNIQTTK